MSIPSMPARPRSWMPTEPGSTSTVRRPGRGSPRWLPIGVPTPPAAGTGPVSVGVGWPTSHGDGCPTITDPGGTLRATGGSGTMVGPGVRRGFTGPTVEAISAGVRSGGTPRGGGVADGAGVTTRGITPVMVVVITRPMAVGQLGLGGAMSCRREPATCGWHGRSGLRIWCWTWRGERAGHPWTVAPGRWSPNVILPVPGSVASSGRVAIR